MLSLTACVLPNTSLLQQSSPFNIQAPLSFTKHKRASKTGNSNNYSNSHCFSCKSTSESPSASYVEYPATTNSTGYKGTPGLHFSKTESASEFVDSSLLALWLQSCYRVKDIRRIHAFFLKCLRDSGTYVNNNLLSGYLKLGELLEARKVFDAMPERNVVSWTAMINGYFKFGLDDEALSFFSQAIKDGVVPNSKTFVCVLNLCSRRLDFELGRQVHARVVKGNWRNLIVDSAVVYFYVQCGDLKSAFCVFDRMVERDVVSWTTMITACSQQGRCGEAFRMYTQMLNGGFLPNGFTASGILKACGEEKALKFGKQIHGAIVKKMYKDDVFVGTSLVDMYAKCGEVSDSSKVFNGMRRRNTVTWTSIIAGYARKGLGEEAICLFRIMKRRRVVSNNLTIVSMLRACGLIGALLAGREVHAQIIKNCSQSNEYLGSTLVWFYCKCGESHTASKVLQQMPFRDVVSWTAIISGHACLGHESEALEFLKEMMEEGVEPNSFTYSSALKACANLETVLQGKLIHSSANKTPASSNVFVGSALIHMYARCGYVSEAIQVFDSMPERNLVTWRAMIMGYVRNGLCQEALKLMYRMQAEGIQVDDYISAKVLGACGEIEWDAGHSSEYCLRTS
ncbi:PREDICTED: pentatricopeptide repeat-containing protein At4g18520 [Populus euphratica]|uniref:Pentatricopeptide repeat-containing protein At4g18520 n=4 Tax=Populus TaxID=3689 RepID=A0AAJ6TGI9_POPEU|nr:PREDICTED: pentatricopeptide repeat-containing protein At4g18520 [Populus euphratica]XP_011010361.1 PREDICTED: pentatricopeptide repeat-containing protein At4g18520 [Populus euphratica]